MAGQAFEDRFEAVARATADLEARREREIVAAREAAVAALSPATEETRATLRLCFAAAVQAHLYACLPAALDAATRAIRGEG